MHILLIHQAFVSAHEAGGTRHYELSRHIARKGHKVTIIASTVSYLTGRVLPSARGRWLAREHVDGIEVYRTWAYPALHRSFSSRIINFLSFMLSSFLGCLLVKNVDVVWGTSPPIFQGLSAWLAGRLKGVPYLFEVRDLWPDFAIEMGILRNRLLIRISRAVEQFLYRCSDGILVNGSGFIGHLLDCGVPDKKIELVPNGVEMSMFRPSDEGKEIRRDLGIENRFVVLYAGAHGPANDLGTLLLAAKRLEEYRDVVFVLVGDGMDRPNLIRQAEHLGLSNVHFIHAQPKARIPAFLASSDVCVAILKPIPMFGTGYPNKVLDYMASGRPTVLAIDGVIRGVIETAEGGTFVRPGDPEALADAVLAYYRDPELRRRHGRNARTYVAAHFDRGQQAQKLIAIFQSLRKRERRRTNPSTA
ncbi:glycosyltransferase family 4 protein [bacterium]|nr:glycosyltransferase family 4 protein [bacterium]